MKLRLLVTATTVLALGVSSAVAAPPPGKGKPNTAGKPATAGKPETAGKPPTTGALCRPKVTVVLKGTLASPQLTSTSTSLLLDVTHANWWGRPYTGAVTVTVGEMTKVRRNGKKLLADLVQGDRLLVQARACKADLKAADPLPTLTVVRLVAHPREGIATTTQSMRH